MCPRANMCHGENASQLQWRGLPEEGKSSPHVASACQSRAEAKRLHHPFPIRISEVASTPVLKPPRLAFPLLRRMDLTEFHQVIKQVTPEVEVFIPAILCLYNLSEILNERATLKLREDEDPGG
jgi:hypothetical protein